MNLANNFGGLFYNNAIIHQRENLQFLKMVLNRRNNVFYGFFLNVNINLESVLSVKWKSLQLI